MKITPITHLGWHDTYEHKIVSLVIGKAQNLNKHDVQSRQSWETLLNQTHKIECSNVQTRNWTESCEKIQNKIMKSRYSQAEIVQSKSNQNPSKN